MKTFDEVKVIATAIAAAKKSSRWAYRHNYVGGDQIICVREPTAHKIHLTSLHSWDYADLAGCSISTALNHLRKLAAFGLITEDPRSSTTRRFRLLNADAMRIGHEIIAELQAEGLPFEDDWRVSRSTTKEAA